MTTSDPGDTRLDFGDIRLDSGDTRRSQCHVRARRASYLSEHDLYLEQQSMRPARALHEARDAPLSFDSPACQLCFAPLQRCSSHSWFLTSARSFSDLVCCSTHLPQRDLTADLDINRADASTFGAQTLVATSGTRKLATSYGPLARAWPSVLTQHPQDLSGIEKVAVTVIPAARGASAKVDAHLRP